MRAKRCQEDINDFWMGHKPKTMSELYSRMDEELNLRLQKAELSASSSRFLLMLLQNAPKSRSTQLDRASGYEEKTQIPLSRFFGVV